MMGEVLTFVIRKAKIMPAFTLTYFLYLITYTFWQYHFIKRLLYLFLHLHDFLG